MEVQLRSEATAYQAFKGLTFKPGDAEAVRAWVDHLEAAGADPEAIACARGALAEPQELEFEFNRMCVGPYRLTVPPYESVWRSGARELCNRYTAGVAEHYAQIGLVIDDGLREPADFIGNELEFLFCVTALEQDRLAASDLEAVQELRAIHDAFLREHLGHWYGQFCTAMADDARHPFWRHYALALKRFLDTQVDALPEPAAA